MSGTTDVFMICNAYEVGVGKGIQGLQAKDNPNDDSAGLNRHCHEAWELGRQKGASIRELGDPVAHFEALKELVEADREGWQAGMNGNTGAQAHAADRFKKAMTKARWLVSEKVSQK